VNNQSKPNSPHASNLRKYRRIVGAATFFVTKCVEPRKNVLIGKTADTICQCLCYYAEHDKIKLAAFVVMPDHWHALFATKNGEPIKQRMHTIGSWVGKSINSVLLSDQTKWQKGFYETRIRSSKQFKYVIDYIENNPVRAGFVHTKADWKWSSAFPAHQSFLHLPWPWVFEKDIK